MRVLISPIGTTDPIRDCYDGPMLHIARYYQPDVVYLLMTEAMLNKEKKEAHFTSALKFLYEEDLKKTVQIEIIDLAVSNPAIFSNLFGYSSIIDAIINKHPEAVFYANISSGTPQMISALCLDLVVHSRPVKAIQVTTPVDGPNTSLPNDRGAKEYEMNIDRELIKNRCIESDIYLYKKEVVRNRLLTLIEQYDYKAAYALLQQEKTLFSDQDLLRLVEYGLKHSRLQFDYDKSLFKTYNLSDVKGTEEVVDIIHYYQSLKLAQKRSDIIALVIRTTPLYYSLSRYAVYTLKDFDAKVCFKMNYKKICVFDSVKMVQSNKNLSKMLKIDVAKEDVIQTWHLEKIYGYYENNNISEAFTKLQRIHESLRNELAHDIKQHMSESYLQSKTGVKSKDIIALFEMLIHELFGSYLKDINLDFFEDLNNVIVQKIKEEKG